MPCQFLAGAYLYLIQNSTCFNDIYNTREKADFVIPNDVDLVLCFSRLGTIGTEWRTWLGQAELRFRLRILEDRGIWMSGCWWGGTKRWFRGFRTERGTKSQRGWGLKKCWMYVVLTIPAAALSRVWVLRFVCLHFDHHGFVRLLKQAIRAAAFRSLA